MGVKDYNKKVAFKDIPIGTHFVVGLYTLYTYVKISNEKVSLVTGGSKYNLSPDFICYVKENPNYEDNDLKWI